MALALAFCDSFQHYPTSALTRKWSAVANAVIVATGGRPPRNSSYLFMELAGQYAYKTLGASYQDHYVHVAFLFEHWPGATPDQLVAVYDTATMHVNARLDQNGRLCLYNNTTLLGTTTNIVVPNLNVWHSLELLCHIADSPNGWAALRIDEQLVLDLTGIDTQNGANANANRLYLTHGGSGSVHRRFCDVVWRVGTGAAVPADFWGDLRVDYQPPNAAGNYGSWTATGAATRLACVSETAPDDDTTYNSDSTPGNRDSYTFAATPAGLIVKGGQLVALARKDDVGSRQVSLFNREGGADYDGAAQVMGDNYAYYLRQLDTQGGGGAWDKASWDAAESGYREEV
jgi:hypothetical protein